MQYPALPSMEYRQYPNDSVTIVASLIGSATGRLGPVYGVALVGTKSGICASETQDSKANRLGGRAAEVVNSLLWCSSLTYANGAANGYNNFTALFLLAPSAGGHPRIRIYIAWSDT